MRTVPLLVLTLLAEFRRLLALLAAMLLPVISALFLVILLLAIFLIVLLAGVFLIVVPLLGLFVLVPDFVSLERKINFRICTSRFECC